MEEIIIQLIKDDIKITKFVHSLEQQGIIANELLIETHPVIFELLQIDKDIITEDFIDHYFQLIDAASKMEQEEVDEFIKGIIATLITANVYRLT